jgi:tRNA modification GTPase
MQEDLIAALATPPGMGAIALLRLSGPGAIEAADRIFRGRQPVSRQPPRTVAVGKIISENRTVDEVMLTVFHAPSSYTGEEMVEISCHGGVLVSAMILRLLFSHGARAAGPGEFTQRAFLNGKLDLTQAEAVMDLIQARTPLALRAATEQLEGKIGEATRAIAGEIAGVLAHVEASIDFPEEGIDPDTGARLGSRLALAREQVRQLLATADDGRILREGVRLVLCGRPNAGKSSLLNRLVGYDRAIVSEIPGTTRDTLDEFISLQGIPFRITDTAGIRESGDEIEAQGVARARDAVSRADLVLELLDGSQPGCFSELPVPIPSERHLIVWNKSDLGLVDPSTEGLRISCLTGEGTEALVTELVRRAGHHEHAPEASLAAINARHQACLLRADQYLQSAMEALQTGVEPEFLAMDLRSSLDAVGEIVGRIDSDEILGLIFKNFCIGK